VRIFGGRVAAIVAASRAGAWVVIGCSPRQTDGAERSALLSGLIHQAPVHALDGGRRLRIEHTGG
jgi:hypothetical protein